VSKKLSDIFCLGVLLIRAECRDRVAGKSQVQISAKVNDIFLDVPQCLEASVVIAHRIT
jgi:hypothetical protein